jgi:6-pyruvoyltetrahydropterin/6-carboxytetrahydropterin synthase
MYELSIATYFSSAHNLRSYQGECEKLHGHNWKVEVIVVSEGLDEIGIAIDFKILKSKVKEIIHELDHKYLNELKPFEKINPSSENLAKYLYKKISEQLNSNKIKLNKVKVWESNDAFASYYE